MSDQERIVPFTAEQAKDHQIGQLQKRMAALEVQVHDLFFWLAKDCHMSRRGRGSEPVELDAA